MADRGVNFDRASAQKIARAIRMRGRLGGADLPVRRHTSDPYVVFPAVMTGGPSWSPATTTAFAEVYWDGSDIRVRKYSDGGTAPDYDTSGYIPYATPWVFGMPLLPDPTIYTFDPTAVVDPTIWPVVLIWAMYINLYDGEFAYTIYVPFGAAPGASLVKLTTVAGSPSPTYDVAMLDNTAVATNQSPLIRPIVAGSTWGVLPSPSIDGTRYGIWYQGQLAYAFEQLDGYTGTADKNATVTFLQGMAQSVSG